MSNKYKIGNRVTSLVKIISIETVHNDEKNYDSLKITMLTPDLYLLTWYTLNLEYDKLYGYYKMTFFVVYNYNKKLVVNNCRFSIHKSNSDERLFKLENLKYD